MKDLLLGKMMWTQQKLKNCVERAFKNEEGDTNFVAIIVIIVIILAIAVIFKDSLTEAVESVFGQLTDFIGNEGY